jgi:Icc-related predicted phosphoesterase
MARPLAQALSRRLPTAVAQVRAQVRSFGICTHHHLSSGADTIGQLVANVPSGLSLTQPQETKKKLPTV